MKNGLKYILAAVCSALVIIIAVIGYNALIKAYGRTQNAPGGESSASSGQSTDALSGESNTGNESETDNEYVYAAIDFTVTDNDGSSVSLSEFFGKPIIINFWTTWCSPCKYELPEFNDAYKEHRDDVTFLMVNMTDGYRDTISGVKSFVENGGYEFPVYFDTESSASNAYSVYSFPFTVMIDKNGNIVNTHLGAMDGETLADYIDALINAE